MYTKIDLHVFITEYLSKHVYRNVIINTSIYMDFKNASK
jgi:hypothetical protein